MRGRKSQPAEVKEAKGNPGRRPTGAVSTADVPELSGGAPAHLTTEGKKIWRDLAPQLRQTKLIRQTDRLALARYCDTLADYWKVTRELRTKKHVYEAERVDGGKMLRVNPLFMVQDRLARRLDTMEDRFGLTPRARQELFYRLAQAPAAPPLPGLGDEGEEGRPDGPVGMLASTGPAGKRVH